MLDFHLRAWRSIRKQKSLLGELRTALRNVLDETVELLVGHAGIRLPHQLPGPDNQLNGQPVSVNAVPVRFELAAFGRGLRRGAFAVCIGARRCLGAGRGLELGREPAQGLVKSAGIFHVDGTFWAFRRNRICGRAHEDR